MTKDLSRHIASFIVFAAFLFFALGSMDTDADTEKVQSRVTDHYVSVNKLCHAYNENEVAADFKYKGKIVIVFGTIHHIGKGLMDNAYIVIRGDGWQDSVQCFFTKGEEYSLARLSKGQKVRVKGEVTGKEMGYVLVKNCRLQED